MKIFNRISWLFIFLLLFALLVITLCINFRYLCIHTRVVFDNFFLCSNKLVVLFASGINWPTYNGSSGSICLHKSCTIFELNLAKFYETFDNVSVNQNIKSREGSFAEKTKIFGLSLGFWWITTSCRYILQAPRHLL